MHYVAREAALQKRDEHGVSYRAQLRASAAKGNIDARRRLTPLPYPDSLRYLHEWALELVGSSGEGMNGLAPLTWTTINDWSERTGRNPSRSECVALKQLDHALRHPELITDDDGATDDDDAPTAPLIIPAWPNQTPSDPT